MARAPFSPALSRFVVLAAHLTAIRIKECMHLWCLKKKIRFFFFLCSVCLFNRSIHKNCMTCIPRLNVNLAFCFFFRVCQCICVSNQPTQCKSSKLKTWRLVWPLEYLKFNSFLLHANCDIFNDIIEIDFHFCALWKRCNMNMKKKKKPVSQLVW